MKAAADTDHIIIPKPLATGSTIAIVTPATSIKDQILDSIYTYLMDRGYNPVIYPHAYGQEFGTHPAPDEARAKDLMDAFTNPDIDAILCSRGGYGCVRLLPMIDVETIRANPKWLIGYSDISVLHAVMQKARIVSLHGPMAKHLTSEPDSLEATQMFYKAVTDSFPLTYQLPPHPYNKLGQANGRLIGGNLITVNSLTDTPIDIFDDYDDSILFFEDIGEQIYAVERILMQLHYSGKLARTKAIVVGQFTEYKPSDNFETMEDMIHYWLHKWGYYGEQYAGPIIFDFPTGHVTDNYPMIVSAHTIVAVDENGTTFSYPGD